MWVFVLSLYLGELKHIFSSLEECFLYLKFFRERARVVLGNQRQQGLALGRQVPVNKGRGLDIRRLEIQNGHS